MSTTTLLDIITPDYLKKTSLLGVDLTTDDGAPFPNEIYETSIQASIQHIENDIGINLEPFKVSQETHDAERQGRFSYWPMKLDYRPIVSIDKVRIRFGSFQPVDLPVSWIRMVSAIHGQMHIIPSQESLGSYFFTAGMPILGNYGIFYEGRDFIPGYFEFDYTAGFETRKETITFPAGQTQFTVNLSKHCFLKYRIALTLPSGITGKAITLGQDSFVIELNTAPVTDIQITYLLDTLPSDIKHMITLKASSNMILQVAGDLILGAGIASSSIGIDGLSQSIQTTSSAMYSGYSSRVDYYEKQYDALKKAVKAQYKINQFGVI
jgi:hypothetical protein|nr:MAG TPA: head to tail adaptor [Herelleviridae sp.]